MEDLSWPPFLDLLNNDPDTAFADFYRFAVTTLTSTPPRPMRSLNQDDCQDLIHDIIYHCVKDNFRVLRQYAHRRKPFAAWLYAIAHNLCLDRLRSKGYREEAASSNITNLIEILPIRDESVDKRIGLKELIAIVRKTITQLSQYCRLLLEMAADEFTPKEIVKVLRLPADQNKKVSDDLRECRRKLKKRLGEAGIDIGALIKA